MNAETVSLIIQGVGVLAPIAIGAAVDIKKLLEPSYNVHIEVALDGIVLSAEKTAAMIDAAIAAHQAKGVS